MPVCIGNTPVYTEICKFRHFRVNHAHSAHPKTTQEETFPGPSQLQKLNQFKPVLASGKNPKNIKFLPFCTNFTHFYFEFLKIFIFSESMDPQDHYGTCGSRIHPVLTEINIAPRKWMYQFDFYCIVTSVIH